ncbi:MAG: biotin--[acetyl-CoA-carboxylase] ligase [Phycisphaerae bacterium]|nr:biotin--[acetyl-CoA-carboxylase] ligase [Phycisphaerae bacterium]
MNYSDRLDPDMIAANLKTNRIGRKVIVFQSTSSTNDIAAEYLNNPDNDGFAFFAEEQNAGRGRGANKWVSKKGDGLLCSVILTEFAPGPELLSLTAAVAVAETIGDSAKIKWPNDILIGTKKIAGILVEKKNTGFIVGIGINCHQSIDEFPDSLKNKAISLDMATGAKCFRPTVAKRLLTHLDYWFGVACESEQKIINKWQQLSIHLGHRVNMLYDGRKISGNCIGVDPQKGIILQLDGGAVKMFDAAHSSIIS